MVGTDTAHARVAGTSGSRAALPMLTITPSARTMTRSTRRGRYTSYQSPNEALAYFVHVYWSADESKVGVVATGSGLWELAFDARTGKPTPFIEIRDGMNRSIAELLSQLLDEIGVEGQERRVQVLPLW